MIYRIILGIRHFLFDKGWKKSYRADVPTICVGNVSVGGTGKTPHTEMILRLRERGDIEVRVRGTAGRTAAEQAE